MLAHADSESPVREVLPFEVAASHIADLRDSVAMAAIGVDLEAAARPWQDDVAAGRTPASWRARETLLDLGAQGLIDLSPKRPGRWRLALLTGNQPGAAPALLR